VQSLTVILLSIISILYQKKNRKKFSRRKKWPKLRYSFNFSDSTTRCRADQKQKMSPIKAVFLQSLHPSFTVGIPFLLYSLRTSEAESLYVCGPEGIADYMDHVSELVLKKRTYPTIYSCECPSSKNIDDYSKDRNDDIISLLSCY